MGSPLPQTMRALVLHDYQKGIAGIQLESRPLPQNLGPGEVLVKISASPINPSDLMFISGQYGIRKPLPTIPGFEGSGTVVATGSDLMSRFLLGKRVACSSSPRGDGTWAEYMKVPALTCLPLPESITDEQGSMMLVNPFTAWALVARAKKEKVSAFIQTAAGSQLGRMIWRLAEAEEIPSIGIVRRKEQKQELMDLGMKYVLCSSEPDYLSQLSKLCEKLNPTLALDAVAGKTAETLIREMPNGSRVVIYGALSLEEPRVSLEGLIFQNKKVEGFWLSEWFKHQNLLNLLLTWKKVQKRTRKELGSTVRGIYRLEQFQEALKGYSDHMSGGKILFRP